MWRGCPGGGGSQHVRDRTCGCRVRTLLCGCRVFLGGRVRYVERVWLRSNGQGPCVVWCGDMQVERFVGGGGGSVGG